MSAMDGPRRHSIPAGDLVLAMLPPLFGATWLGAGLVRIKGILQRSGIQPRVVRVLDDMAAVPDAIRYDSYHALVHDSALEDRLARLGELAEGHRDFFDRVLDVLLAGPERLFAFSVWRTNVTVICEVSRLLKEHRPDCAIILGGPEAIERSQELRLPWFDAVVSAAADTVITPLVRAFLDGRSASAAPLPGVWIHPRHDTGPSPSSAYAPDPPEVAEGITDYSDLLPLALGEGGARVPVTLNVGCVYECGFCTNKSIYPSIHWGTVERCAAELRQISELWSGSFDSEPPALSVELCDATLNVDARQFEQLCDAVIESSMPYEPTLTGCLLLDKRITPARLEKMLAAGLTDVFHGLESASPRIRRSMNKPGRIEDVRAALRLASEVGGDDLKVALGVLVGWPGESEQDYHATVSFIEWYAQLTNLRPYVAVNSLIYTPLIHGAQLFETATAKDQGLLWRLDGDAGAPQTRCRRLMGIIERFRGAVEVASPIPVELLVQWMLPELPRPFWDAWQSRYLGADAGEREDATEPPAPEPGGDDSPDGDDAGSPVEQPLDDPAFASRTALLASLFQLDESQGLYVEVRPDPYRSLVRVSSHDGATLLEMIVEDRDESRPCYRRTLGYNVMLKGQHHSEQQQQLADLLLKRFASRERALRERSADGPQEQSQ